MNARLRWRLGRLMLVAPLALILGVTGVLWMVDRQRDWGEPRWETRSFVPVDARHRGTVPTHEQRIVPVNTDCPHCSGHLERATARRRNGVTVHALVVDQRLRPPHDVFPDIEVDGVWWDSSGVWRHEWGHRLYGETLVFDRDGRLLTTLAPSTGAEIANADRDYGVPPDDH